MSVDLTGPITLRPSRLKTSGLLTISLIFVGTGVWMLNSNGAAPATAWLTVIFFGVGTVVFAVMLLPGASYLRLEPGGYTVCTLFRSSFYPWSTVRGFGVTRIFLRRMVGINLEPGSGIAAGLGRVNARLVGFEGALPDTYGMSAAALAALMNEALARAKLRG